MPQLAEYLVFEGPAQHIQVKLNELAAQGFEPILMSTVMTQVDIRTTVILRHILSNQ